MSEPSAYQELADGIKKRADALVEQAQRRRDGAYKFADTILETGVKWDETIAYESARLDAQFDALEAMDKKFNGKDAHDPRGAEQPGTPQGAVVEDAHSAAEHKAAE